MASPGVIVAENGTIKPKKQKLLEAAGYIVLLVDNVDKIKVINPRSVKPADVDEGFNLNA